MGRVSMKCKTCRKRKQRILISYDFIHHGREGKAIRVPAQQCPQCEAIDIVDAVRENVKRYFEACDNQIVDYAKCEEEEIAAMIATQMLL